MLNITTDKNNIAKYKETLLLSDLSEQYSKDRHNLKQVLNASHYFITLGDNEFNGIGYFYFTKQRYTKKDCIFITFSKANKENEALNIYKLALAIKVKALDSTKIVNLCEALINADEFSEVLADFDKHLLAMLNACGLEYEIEKVSN